MATDAQGLDLRAMMRALGAQGLTRVLCEGGGQLAAGLLRAGLVDRIVVFSAGALIGSQRGARGSVLWAWAR
jgi:diaminohydroxyphosphoribosylaminopyrimidine deaminase / 5-amino-6-(5-phosphoribosylamino)uracil reductase